MKLKRVMRDIANGRNITTEKGVKVSIFCRFIEIFYGYEIFLLKAIFTITPFFAEIMPASLNPAVLQSNK